MSTLLHKKETPRNIRVAIVSVSTTRGIAEDKSGIWMKKEIKKEGHETVVHHVVTDEIDAIRDMLNHVVDDVEPHVNSHVRRHRSKSPRCDGGGGIRFV